MFSSLQSWGVELGQLAFAPVVQPVIGAGDFASAIANIQQTKVAELDLRSRVAELEEQIAGSADLASENKWLREQLSLGIARETEGVLANVVRYEYSPVVGYLYLDAGSNLVGVGDTVIVNRYVIGEVTEVYDTLCRVRLISANGTEIPVQIGSSAAGVLRGRSGLQIVVTDVDARGSVQMGDTVRYLTPLGADVGKFSLGKVVQVNALAASPTKELEIEMPLDLFSLRRVIILSNQIN